MKMTSALASTLTSINAISLVESFVMPKLSTFATKTNGTSSKASSNEEDLELSRQITLEHAACQEDLEEAMKVLNKNNDFEHAEDEVKDDAIPVVTKSASGETVE